jgi:ABC-type nitrate/sulfonate/bicarbonate transport system substrate-binding protein
MNRRSHPRPGPRLVTPTNRRQFLGRSLAVGGATLLGPTLLAACGDDSDSSSASGASGGAGGQRVSTVFSWVKNVEWAGFWVGDSEGHYEDEGIVNDFIGGGPNAPENVQVIEAGEAGIGLASDTLKIIDASAEGADFVMFAAVLQESPVGFAWLDPEIETIEDLVGKKIGGDASSPSMIDACFAVNGIPNDYEFVRIGYDPAPLASGEVDAILCYVTNQVSVLESQGLTVHTATLTDFGVPLYADALFAKRGFLDENHDLVVAYLRATIMGHEHNMADPELGARLATEEYGLDLALDYEGQLTENRKQIEYWESDVTREKGILWMDKDYMAGPMFDGIRAAGRTRLPDLDTLVDLTFLEEAYDGRTSLLDA